MARPALHTSNHAGPAETFCIPAWNQQHLQHRYPNCSYLNPTHTTLPTSASHSAHSMGPTCVQVCLVRRPVACVFRKHFVQKPSPHWSHFLVDLFCSHSTQLDCFLASSRSSSVIPGTFFRDDREESETTASAVSRGMDSLRSGDRKKKRERAS